VTDEQKLLVDLNKDNLARAISFGPIYDGKAKFVLSLVLALVAYLLTEVPRYVAAHAKFPTDPWFVLLDLVCVACFSSFLRATICVIHAIRPKVDQHSQKPSPLFFQCIAHLSLDEFRATMTSLTPDRAVALLVEQTYDNAKIMVKKNAGVHCATDWLFRGMACFLVFTAGQAIRIALLP
jgi:hypothetical protein